MGSEYKPPVTTIEELNARLAGLPDLSRMVYEAIRQNLYAEPGFSDLTAAFIATLLGLEPRQIAGCISHLTTEGLVTIEDDRDRGHQWLHTYEHDDEIR